MGFSFLFLAIILLALYNFISNSDKYGLYKTIRLSVVSSLIINGALIFLYTELFSLFNQLTYFTAIRFWILVNSIYIFLLYRHLKGISKNEILLKIKEIISLSSIKESYRFLLYISIIFFFIPLFLIAAKTPPNNFDSHHYHLTRVLEWYFNHNVNHYPTMYIQQLYLNVFAEYLVLQSFLLTGYENFANIFQFGAMLGSVVAISLLAKAFGLNYRHQILVSVLFFCLPIGVFESTSTQVDYTACFFFICFVLFGYYMISTDRITDAILSLLSLALAGFSKYPALLYAFPFCCFFGYQYFIKYKLKRTISLLLMALLIFSVIYTPFYLRNYELFGSILSPKESSRLFSERLPVEKLSAGSIISNTIKNFGLHLGLPYNNYNVKLDNIITRIHTLINEPIYDPKTSRDVYHTRFSVQEDMAPNSLHLYLFFIILPFVFFSKTNRKIKIVVLLSIAGFILSSSLLKFQFWSSRTQMPFFAMVCLSIGYAFGFIFKRNGYWLNVLMLVSIIPIVYGNPNKQVIAFKYSIKKFLGHIPRDIMVQDKAKINTYKSQVGEYYNFRPNSDVFPIAYKNLSYFDRLAVFNKLNELGYYSEDREESIFSNSRIKLSFQSHLSDYANFNKLLPHFGDAQNIGVFFTKDSGYYHYWSSVQYTRHYPVRMHYIFYKQEYLRLPNARRDWAYNYILTDNLDGLYAKIAPASIDTVYTSNSLALVKLKAPSNRVYTF